MSDAADKLAQTRLAIIAHIQRREQRSSGPVGRHERTAAGTGRQGEADWEQAPDEEPHGRVRDWYQRARRMGSAWWRHHPAHAGLELATPVMSSFAARSPVAYLGVSALVGAAFVIARPRRLVSVTGLLVALLKSSQLSGLILSAMSPSDDGQDGRSM